MPATKGITAPTLPLKGTEESTQGLPYAELASVAAGTAFGMGVGRRMGNTKTILLGGAAGALCG